MCIGMRYSNGMNNLAYLHNGNQAAATIAANVRAEIGRADINDADLAAAIEITPMAMSRRLNGSVAFTVSEVQAIANYFGVGPGDLFTEHSRDSPPASTMGKRVGPTGIEPMTSTVEYPRLATVTDLSERRAS